MEQYSDNKISWAPRLPFSLVRRLYKSFSSGIYDDELCDDVGIRLYLRCETFIHVWESKVACPVCRTVFKVAKEGTSYCPNEKCGWSTDFNQYWASIRPYYAWPGRAMAAWEEYYEKYPGKKTFHEKIILIDQLIHSFHIDEKTNLPVKTVGSKLFEGKRKVIVQMLDELSGIESSKKEQWREEMLLTIDKTIMDKDPS
jgi:hypothetical protein